MVIIIIQNLVINKLHGRAFNKWSIYMKQHIILKETNLNTPEQVLKQVMSSTTPQPIQTNEETKSLHQIHTGKFVPIDFEYENPGLLTENLGRTTPSSSIKRFTRIGSEGSLVESTMSDKAEIEIQALKDIIKNQNEEIQDLKERFAQMYELFVNQQQQDKQQYKQLEEKLIAAEAARTEDARKLEKRLSEERIAIERASAESLENTEAKLEVQAGKMRQDSEILKAQITGNIQAQQEDYQELLFKFNKFKTSAISTRPDEFLKLADPIIDSELLVNPYTTNEQKAIIAGRTKNLEDLVKIAETPNAPLDLLLAILASPTYQLADADYLARIDSAYSSNINVDKIKRIQMIINSVPPPANVSMMYAYKAAVIIDNARNQGGTISINSKEEANYIAQYETLFPGTAEMIVEKIRDPDSMNNIFSTIPDIAENCIRKRHTRLGK